MSSSNARQPSGGAGGNDNIYKAVGITATVGAVAFLYWYIRNRKSEKKNTVSTSLILDTEFSSTYHILPAHSETKGSVMCFTK